ncbi:MAG: DUF3458 domain-containing protein, partial [Deltaproteobacteria bacterium]|nr:DUF3458 domain-containing protein [Deltaproteobacteria bacterium]
AMADANDEDLDQFKRWYEQSGTPEIHASGTYDEATRQYSLRLRQHNPNSGIEDGDAPPLHIPVVVGLLGPHGEDLPIDVGTQSLRRRGTSCVLELTEEEQEFVFRNLDSRPVPSVLRDFSAPVRLRMDRSREELAFLMAHDSDAFTRWDAGEELATALLLEMTADAAAGRPLTLDPLLSDAFGKILADERLDHSLHSLALTLPGEKVLGMEMKEIDVDGLHAAREFMIHSLASTHRDMLTEIYRALATPRKHRTDRGSIADRRVKNAALGYLASLEQGAITALIYEQFSTATNMTDAQAALGLLVNIGGYECDLALSGFHERWRKDPLVLDKWFSVQAMSKRPDALERVVALTNHADFSLKNPNRMRSLLGVFCAANQVRFHDASGEGYRLLSDVVLELDLLNPQLSARMVSQFNQWRRFEPGRRAQMKAELERIAEQPSLSKDVFEIVERSLNG